MNNNWERLYSTSKQLTQATSAQSMFSDDDISFIEERLKNILVTFFEKGELHRGLKVYVDGELDHHYVRKMADQKPENSQSMEGWCLSIFEDKKFGFVFNSLESYDNALVERMCQIIHPLIKEAGIPLGGLSFLFFMGNYGFTPFGIHKEAKGEEGFLFHMGPSPKTFYTWDIEEYNRIEHNTEVFHNVTEMLPLAQSYELSPKSVMFIPNHLYHIANTEEFSFSVVMDYINPSNHALETMIAKNMIQEMEDSSLVQDYLSSIPMEGEVTTSSFLHKSSWEEKYQLTLNRHIARLRSNHGILKPAIYEFSDSIRDDDFSVQGKPIFPLIEFVDHQQQHYVMARGREIPVEKNNQLASILDGLNHGDIFSFKELQKKLVNGDWELHHLYDFVSQLLLYGSIQKVG